MFQSFHTIQVGTGRGILPDSHAQQRGTVALIGTLGGSGLSCLLGIFLTPALKSSFSKQWRFGQFSNVNLLAAVGTVLLFLGYLGASFSTQVSSR